MKSNVVAVCVACLAAFAASVAGAAETAPAPTAIALQVPSTPLAESAEVDRLRAGEPLIRRTIIDDRVARIEELRVRGQLQKITVDLKGRAPDYEILTGDGSRDLLESASGPSGAAGKRVWNVLRF